jgi:uncharacterized membrane protein (DUF2068 family)
MEDDRSMSDEPTTPRPATNPRLLLAFIGVIMAAQAVYAGIDLFGGAAVTGTPVRPVLSAGFLVYAAMIVVFAFAIWRETWWAWHLAVAIAATGLAIAAVRIAGGETFEQLALGIVIDGVLLYYLQRSSIKVLFGR